MNANTLRAYHGDAAVKAKYVERFAQHRTADAVIQGQGYENGRGCFVGCTLQNYDHSRFPIELGWPEWLARLADTIFEGLPKKDAPQFGTDLLMAVPLGADLDSVKGPFLLSVQRRNLERLKGNTKPYAQQCRNAIQGVITWLEAGMPEAQRAAAESAADSAARLAARSAAESAAWSAAWSAADSAAGLAARLAARSAADSAAWPAADSAAGLAAESAAWSAAESAAGLAAGLAAESAARLAARSAARSAESQTQRGSLLSLLAALETA